MDNRYVIIMAGGVGSRFWPLSRREKPKQFLDIIGSGETLIQQTFRRFKKCCPEKNIFVVTKHDHRDLVIEQLDIDPSQVLVEPFRRNTAPCLAYGTFRILKENPDAVITVTPADHLIVKEDKFNEVIQSCISFAEANDALVTLGIKPDRPETGYGYIQADQKKPVKGYQNLLKLKHLQKSLILIWQKYFLKVVIFTGIQESLSGTLKQFMKAFEKHMPDMFHIFDEGREIFGTKQESSFIGKTYAECRNISIDYGIMEKADNVYVMGTDIGWSDLGTWSSLYEHSPVDKNENSIIRGEVFSYDNHGNIFNINPGKIAVIQGLKDYIVVDSDNVLLIVKKEEEQNIKQFLEDVKNSTKEKFL